jgi:hypothetical protein
MLKCLFCSNVGSQAMCREETCQDIFSQSVVIQQPRGLRSVSVSLYFRLISDTKWMIRRQQLNYESVQKHSTISTKTMKQ